MENKENRGLIDKMASKDQLEKYCSHFLELSHYSLSRSYSRILRVFLENSWRGWILGDLDQEGKGRAGKHKHTSESIVTMGFDYRF